MCELLALSCSRPARMAFALGVLAAHGAASGGTRDGWGVAFYHDRDVALFREPAAAGDSPLVRFLQTQAPGTKLAISHIRRATRGAISLPNTQPFAREVAGGMHVFAHNGDLPGIEQSAALAFDRYRPIGTTDSEHAFCALLERMSGVWASASAPPPVEMRLAAVAGFASADFVSAGLAAEGVAFCSTTGAFVSVWALEPASKIKKAKAIRIT